MTKNWKKLQQTNFFKYFLGIKKYNLPIPRPPERTSKLQKKPSALKREHPALQNMKFRNLIFPCRCHEGRNLEWCALQINVLHISRTFFKSMLYNTGAIILFRIGNIKPQMAFFFVILLIVSKLLRLLKLSG
jgi:hypothetical protein